MKELQGFEVPLSSLTDGIHRYHFAIEDTFFAGLTQDILSSGSFDVQLVLDKTSDVIVLHLQHEGFANVNCDRCLEAIKLPLKRDTRIIIKFVDEVRDDDEITYLVKGTERLDLAPFIFEAISLSLPLVKKYDCQSDPAAPCNPQVLKMLDEGESTEEPSPVWEELKKLNFKS